MSRLTFAARAALWIGTATVATTAMILAAAFLYLSPDLPSVDALRDVRLQTPLRVYTADGILIGEFGEQRRTPIRFEDVPPQFIAAVLAAEDHGFYQHHGVDFTSLLRATSQLVRTGRIQTGGSTITMQVARNYFLNHARTFSRKFNEILLALQIERELDKNEILELYVNKIFLGHRAYGIEAASQVYYGKPIQQLDLAQLAMIAGLPKAPSSNNPLTNPTRALERRNWILGRMLELGDIDQAAYQQAVNSPVTARYHGPAVGMDAGFVAEMVRQEVLQRYGAASYTDGYVAYATIHSDLQRTAQAAVINGLLNYDQRHGYRGPEARLPEDATPDRAHWREELREWPAYGGLRAAVVTKVAERSVTALFADGEQATVGWEHGLSTAQPYLSVNSRGPRPQRAADVVRPGDVIRLRWHADAKTPADGDGAETGAWHLTQLPEAQAALVALDADSGAIRSLVGGFDFALSKFNRATQAQRQPGSAFKPFLYSAALEYGFTAASLINDAPVVFEDAQLESQWRPSNDSGKFYGPTRLRRALYLSRNLVSIRILRSIGINRARTYLQRFGFDRASLPQDLSLALGSNTTTPLALANAFAVLANGGYRVEPHVLERVDNLLGETLYQSRAPVVCQDCVLTGAEEPDIAPDEAEAATMADILADNMSAPAVAMPPLAERVLEPRVAFIIDSILRDVIKHGTGRRALVLQRDDLAGKTGTTNGPTDAWFAGYGGGLVSTAWVGFDQYQPLGRNEYGGSAALPIWIEYMREALRNQPERVRRQPEGLVSLRIDPTTGLRARPGQADAIFEYFRAEHAPTEMVPDNSTPSDSGSGGRGRLEEEDIF